MKRFVSLLLIISTLSVLSACGGGAAAVATPPLAVVLGTPDPDPTATPEVSTSLTDGKVMSFEVNLALNGSPQQGTAVFTRIPGDVTKIAVRLKPGVRSQPLALRRGQCPEPTGYVSSFREVIGGVLTQEVRDLPFDDLLKGDITLVVGTGNSTFQSMAACGDLPTIE